MLLSVSDMIFAIPVSGQHLYIKENSPPNSFVKQLEAEDDDLAPNAGPFKFRLLPGGHAGLLTLDPDSGILRTSSTIDREAVGPVLKAEVEVKDHGGDPVTSLTARHEIEVEVVDENDSPSQVTPSP